MVGAVGRGLRGACGVCDAGAWRCVLSWVMWFMGVLDEYHRRLAAGGLEPDADQARAAAHLDTLAGEISGWSPGLKSMLFGRVGPGVRGLYLYGGVGRGKSMLMDLFFELVAVARKRRAHFHEFMQEVHAGIGDARREHSDDPIAVVARDIASRSWLLCFDEMQVSDIGDAMILGRLFEGLFGRGVVLVATSNRRPDALYKDGINRQLFVPFIDMLKARVELVNVDGGRDYRLARLLDGSLWRAPLGPYASAALDQMWDRVLAGAEERADCLHVQGRIVNAPRVGGDAARFTFDALCRNPLGAADYLAIARRYRTVFLDDIPRMGPANRNEAKRFVILVDALYEAKVKLVASAEVAPEQLYPAGDGAFEFGRTVSRLNEMQSETYLTAERTLG